jgi:hypothetical protein
VHCSGQARRVQGVGEVSEKCSGAHINTQGIGGVSGLDQECTGDQRRAGKHI